MTLGRNIALDIVLPCTAIGNTAFVPTIFSQWKCYTCGGNFCKQRLPFTRSLPGQSPVNFVQYLDTHIRIEFTREKKCFSLWFCGHISAWPRDQMIDLLRSQQ